MLLVGLVGSSLPAQDTRIPAQSALAGARVFGTAGCAKCHAIDGVGSDVGPDLGRVESTRSIFDLAAAMWNHLPEMARRMVGLGIERPRLRSDEAEAVAVFLATQSYFDARGDRDAGRHVFVGKQCVMCHQIGGQGGVSGPPLDGKSARASTLDLAAAMWTHAPAMMLEMRAQGMRRPQLTGADVTHLATLFTDPTLGQQPLTLRVLPGRPAAGRDLFRSKNCIVCHGQPGSGGRIAPDLAARAAARSLADFAAALWNKTPAMMQRMAASNIAVPSLTGEEMADLVAYLYRVEYFAGAGRPSSGRARVAERGCTRCHGPRGSAAELGGEPMPDLASVIAALWNHVTVLPAAEQPAWPRLRSSEVADIAAFLLNPRPAR